MLLEVDDYRTRHTLLARAVDPADERAWREFVDTYRRFIYHILHHVGIDSDDIDDVAPQHRQIGLTRRLFE